MIVIIIIVVYLVGMLLAYTLEIIDTYYFSDDYSYYSKKERFKKITDTAFNYPYFPFSWGYVIVILIKWLFIFSIAVINTILKKIIVR